MTEKVLRGVRELDSAARNAGGYVTPPSEVKRNEHGQRMFTTMRQYSLRTGKPIRKFTGSDYECMGIKKPK